MLGNRIGVVTVPEQNRAQDHGEGGDDSHEDQCTRPFLLVVRACNGPEMEFWLKQLRFDVASVVVNDIAESSPAADVTLPALTARVDGIRDALRASEVQGHGIPIMPITVGRVSAAAAPDGCGQQDEAFVAKTGDGALSSLVLSFTADEKGSRAWVADAWGNAESRR